MPHTHLQKIDVFTGNRADYGLLRPLLKGLAEEPNVQARLLVGGEHSWNKTTHDEIVKDETGVTYYDIIPSNQGLRLKEQSISYCMAEHQLHIESFWLDTYKPDVLVVLGDRYETAAVVTCAFTMGIHIMHLAAGDSTQGGALDDQFRFSISCMANTLVAFSNKSYITLQALTQLTPKTILQTSSLAVDNALQVPDSDRLKLLTKYQLDHQKPFALFTQHGIHSEKESNWANIKSSLEALSKFDTMQFLITASNTDIKDTMDLNEAIQAFIQPYAHLHYTESTGYSDYVNLLRLCSGVIGNSSSGLYETPLYKVPCLNIGSRQSGREHSSNVIHCEYGVNAVLKGLNDIFLNQDFSDAPKDCVSPFGNKAGTPSLLAWLQQC